MSLQKIIWPIVGVVLIAAGVGLGYLFLGGQKDEVSEVPDPGAGRPQPTAAPVQPSPEPQPPPDEVPPPADTGPSLADIIGDARDALNAGDYEQAIDHLTRATIIEPRHALVLDTAKSIVIRLVQSADHNMDRGQTDAARQRLERARNVALRFGFGTQEMDRRIAELTAPDRRREINPRDVPALRSMVGKKVNVTLQDGSTREGWVKSVTSQALSIDMQTSVGAGHVRMTHNIPLETIKTVELID
jgi:hypothetical protein